MHLLCVVAFDEHSVDSRRLSVMSTWSQPFLLAYGQRFCAGILLVWSEDLRLTMANPTVHGPTVHMVGFYFHSLTSSVPKMIQLASDGFKAFIAATFRVVQRLMLARCHSGRSLPLFSERGTREEVNVWVPSSKCTMMKGKVTVMTTRRIRTLHINMISWVLYHHFSQVNTPLGPRMHPGFRYLKSLTSF